MKYITFFCFLALSVVYSGCSQNNTKSSKIIRTPICNGLKSANSIVIIEGRTMLIYDKKIDKDCGSI